MNYYLRLMRSHTHTFNDFFCETCGLPRVLRGLFK